MNIDQGLQTISGMGIVELPRRMANERHLVVQNENDLRRLLGWAKNQGGPDGQEKYYLCNMVASDDRLLLDRTFKIYYILSGAEDEIVILEYFLSDPERGLYTSISDIFPNASPMEQEIHDLFGLTAQGENGNTTPRGFLLHDGIYPSDFYPLRRRQTIKTLQGKLLKFVPQANFPVVNPHKGMLIVPVGPIHAGIIEAGHFPFHVAGEVVEKLPLRLGYKHRGVEKLFETHYTLQNGWELAEKISGDSAVAHSIAYCHAVENLAGIDLPLVIHECRALFLELERLYNHISDVGLLAIGMAYDRASAALKPLKEFFLQFVNQSVSGNRYLRGLIKPGGVNLQHLVNFPKLEPYIEAIVDETLYWGKKMLEKPECRDRMLTTGILTKEEARYATGFTARASGWIRQDFRLRHPSPAYQRVKVYLENTINSENEYSSREVPIYIHDLEGDVFARMAIRVAEIETSFNLVKEFLKKLQSQFEDPSLQLPSLDEKILRTPEMAMGLGYAEGWRGDVMYMIFKGPGETIARCKVRDPSTFNWHVFAKAVVRKLDRENNQPLENILADFPLINKSFNLAYAGHDL